MTEKVTYTECPYCHKEVKDTPRSMGSHIGYWHKGISKEIYRKGKTYRLECLECNEKVANSNNVLARHVRSAHGIEWPDYLVHHQRNGIWPTCLCGCEEKLVWRKGGFPRFIKGHENRGENNPMYRPKPPEPIVVEEVELIEELEEPDIELPITPPVMKPKPVITPEIPDLHEAQWMPHPLDQKRDVYVSTLQEKRFLEEKSAEKVFITPTHEITIPYVDADGDQQTFAPRFLSAGEGTVYEVEQTDQIRLAAAAQWCAKEGLQFRVVRYVNGQRVVEPYSPPPRKVERDTTSTKVM